MKSKLKENRRQLQFSLSNYNRKHQQIIWYTLNALDVYTTHRGMDSPRVREANPLLPNRPSFGELILFKTIFLTYLHDMPTDNYVFGNRVMAAVVVNNTYVLHEVGIIDLND